MSNFQRCRKKKPEPQKKVPDGKKKNLADDGVLESLRRKKSSRSKSQSKIEEGHFSESTTRSPIVFSGGGVQFKFIKSL